MINVVKNHILRNMQLERMTLTIEKDFFLPIFLSFYISIHFLRYLSLIPFLHYSLSATNPLQVIIYLVIIHIFTRDSDFYSIDLNSQIFRMIEFGLCFVCLWLRWRKTLVGREVGAEVGWEMGVKENKIGVNSENQKDICLSMALSNSDL